MNFNSKVVLITGARKGIGKAIALKFAENGAKVIVNATKPDAGKTSVETVEIIRSNGGESVFIAGDVSNPKSAESIVNEAINHYGKIDILVNNAGIVIPGSLTDTSEKDFDMTMDVNVKGTFFMSKYTVEYMKKQGSGVIVNIGSVAALKGHVDRAVYCASKGAIVALSRAMAADYVKDNIRVNVICPGTTYTPAIEEKIRNAENPAEMEAVFVNRQPMGRLGKIDEIAHAVLFAACEEAAYMTGSVIVIDGGMTM
ncbi:SDR family oxidoreductase [Sedimentibacter sp.]|uniref:SDR family NAD(P)-dependent oxidoreductase n=1 Tax=Sedimentibacter sp. TaxID=1960295 RepID=UPI0028A69259|nr:SDR family oxidoreductase [Sedimentibacter sp.]